MFFSASILHVGIIQFARVYIALPVDAMFLPGRHRNAHIPAEDGSSLFFTADQYELGWYNCTVCIITLNNALIVHLTEFRHGHNAYSMDCRHEARNRQPPGTP